MPLTHLQRLEAESIHILREVVAECERPVMLYSIGKDGACMQHLDMATMGLAEPVERTHAALQQAGLLDAPPVA